MAANSCQQLQQNPMHQLVNPVESMHQVPAISKVPPIACSFKEVEPRAVPQQTWFQAHFGGLRRTLRFFLLVAITVLIINISWVIYAKTHYGSSTSGDHVVIFRGNCDDARSKNTWLHFLINVLSTLLLTGSNAFMATCCSPSRAEVDKAHAQRKWLRVGVLSFRNFGKIAKRKCCFVVLLALSSVPFHLLYNSMVFESLLSNNYYWTVASPEFLTGAPYNLTAPSGSQSTCRGNTNYPDGTADPAYCWDRSCETPRSATFYTYYDQIQNNASTWKKLSNHDCIRTYSASLLAGRRNVVLISSTRNETNSVFEHDMTALSYENFDDNWWICSSCSQEQSISCQTGPLLRKADDWKVFDHQIEYCLSEQVRDSCEVKFSMSIMIVVLVFNSIKVLVMAMVLWQYDVEDILTCVGDCATSFLVRADETTKYFCLANQRNIWSPRGHTQSNPYNHPNIAYGSRRPYWHESVSKGKWVFLAFVMIVSWVGIAFYGSMAFHYTKERGHSLSFTSLWQLGFGSVNQDTIASSRLPSNVIGISMIVNIPQIFLAIVWLVYMGIMTTMSNEADWLNFGTKSQTLMVSNPRGVQRGTWLFGAPLLYAIPMLVLQISLHWLVSQSIFVISASVYNPDGSPNQWLPQILDCGYSPIAIIFSLLISGILILTLVALAFRKLPRGTPPIGGTCSAVISAACHLPDEIKTDELLYVPMQWGSCGQPQGNIGHCTLMPEDMFKNGYGQAPVPGNIYA